jgi:acyl carrier protein
VNQPEPAEILEFLAQTLRDVFKRNDIEVHLGLTAADVVGWDSMKQVEIILALQEKFGIRIRPRDVANVWDVGGLVALVQQKLSATTAGADRARPT